VPIRVEEDEAIRRIREDGRLAGRRTGAGQSRERPAPALTRRAAALPGREQPGRDLPERLQDEFLFGLGDIAPDISVFMCPPNRLHRPAPTRNSPRPMKAVATVVGTGSFPARPGMEPLTNSATR
jgi:hypothetical protein